MSIYDKRASHWATTSSQMMVTAAVTSTPERLESRIQYLDYLLQHSKNPDVRGSLCHEKTILIKVRDKPKVKRHATYRKH